MRPARRVQCSGEREPSAHVRTQETAPRGGSCGQGRSRHERPRRHAPRGRAASQRRRLEPLQWRLPLRGRLMVGRLTLDQVVKVRVLAPQPRSPLSEAGFSLSERRRRPPRRRRAGEARAGPLRAATSRAGKSERASFRPRCRCGPRPRRTARALNPGASPSAGRRPGRSRRSCSS